MVVLIGSGAEEMVTRNGKSAFELDYNLVLTSVPQKYDDAPGLLRNHIREMLFDLVDERFSHGKGSTFSIRYLAHPKEEGGVQLRCSIDQGEGWKV